MLKRQHDVPVTKTRVEYQKTQRRRFFMKNVFIVGMGTIGEPLTGLLTDYKKELGINRVFFTKKTPNVEHRSKVRDLIERGALFACHEESTGDFRKEGMHPAATFEEALKESAVIIDCTKKKVGRENKERYYSLPENAGKFFLAQGSEAEFGKPFARNISDRILVGRKGAIDQFWKIVSCNTHNAAVIIDTIGLDQGRINCANILDCNLFYIRRSNDVSQVTGFIPSFAADPHDDPVFGTHQGRDAHELFKTIGYDIPIYSSTAKANTQYMHSMYFVLTLAEEITKEEVFARVGRNRLIALGMSNHSCQIFSHGRDHGYFGRILNQTVLVGSTVEVRKSPFGYQVIGCCFTPQDGNSLLSSASLCAWLLDPDSYPERTEIFFQRPFTFREI